MLSPRSFWSYRKDSSLARKKKNTRQSEKVDSYLNDEEESEARTPDTTIDTSKSVVGNTDSMAEAGESSKAELVGSDGTVSDGDEEDNNKPDLRSRLQESFYRSASLSRRAESVSLPRPLALTSGSSSQDKFTLIQELTLSRKENEEVSSKAAAMEEKVIEMHQKLAGAEHRERSMRAFIRELRDINKALQQRVTFLEETMSKISMRDAQWERICSRLQADLSKEQERRKLLEAVIEMALSDEKEALTVDDKEGNKEESGRSNLSF
ncbi:hypothetical protein GUITHDRAFT_143549 [Guillardia theta CCMP2712]|uniref:Uncharacterized protein n=2 Tax=Guillardia theta TaxID=55529 RepID=L1IU43_GUITC|nr:hypothetical protein GUITHDRAFT_143549 [Guillardia theta CCMP2712]EKX39345.1 hypothetical protein GUITHDRAFT_143549 [Guillardia theta CCMP2712]|mmetsp:Transcript_10298/g.34385  ORF Transcript_10298/g.34385 Transcript_10298/m.34385 type:complete len:266 (+) Transcript_10298:368-1165(+)|eukprot:XP_005826325.1 hypothetical protein GUITHDRAFT_143549 [Guillardia theta CCMP2712]